MSDAREDARSARATANVYRTIMQADRSARQQSTREVVVNKIFSAGNIHVNQGADMDVSSTESDDSVNLKDIAAKLDAITDHQKSTLRNVLASADAVANFESALIELEDHVDLQTRIMNENTTNLEEVIQNLTNQLRVNNKRGKKIFEAIDELKSAISETTDSDATVSYPDSASATLATAKVTHVVKTRSATKANENVKAAGLNEARRKAHKWAKRKGYVKK